jgi:hypothetical protein
VCVCINALILPLLRHNRRIRRASEFPFNYSALCVPAEYHLDDGLKKQLARREHFGLARNCKHGLPRQNEKNKFSHCHYCKSLKFRSSKSGVNEEDYRNKTKKLNENKKMPNLKVHGLCSFERTAFAVPRDEKDDTDGVGIGLFIVVIP